MFKNKKKNTGIEEANSEAALTLTDYAVRALLYKIDNEGYKPTDKEIAALKRVERISLRHANRIPRSIDFLANLQVLDLSFTQITYLSGIEKLTNLQSLNLSRTYIADLNGIKNLTNLQYLNLENTQVASLIGIEKLTNLKTLDLRNTRISSLNGIDKLTNLQTLFLMNTKITNVNGIENLTRLCDLNLGGTKIANLSGIENLTNLYELRLSDTYITSLSGIESLTNLQWLDLRNTPIINLSGIENLTNLQKLDLRGTKITSLSGIENLTNLQVLGLWGTKITSLSGIENLTNLQSLDFENAPIRCLNGIENLTNLHSLYLNGTQIDSSELEKLSKLKNLWSLDLRHLRLTRIPPQLLELNLPFDTTSTFPRSKGIFLYGTELTQQPLSLFEQDRSLIEEYYKSETETDNSEMASVSEAKVIFLGHGGVGKTHTIKRIKEKGKFINPIKGETPGISITSIDNFYGAGFNVRFWDFGGQDIMHSMHRCFLTERTCYVIVVNTRQGDLNKQARYWLNNIKSFAPNAPVILFENRWGEGHIGGGLDENRLKKEFPNIRRRLIRK